MYIISADIKTTVDKHGNYKVQIEHVHRMKSMAMDNTDMYTLHYIACVLWLLAGVYWYSILDKLREVQGKKPAKQTILVALYNVTGHLLFVVCQKHQQTTDHSSPCPNMKQHTAIECTGLVMYVISITYHVTIKHTLQNMSYPIPTRYCVVMLEEISRCRWL